MAVQEDAQALPGQVRDVRDLDVELAVLPPTITAPTTARARSSTSARRSPGSTSTPAQWALRFVLDEPGLSVVIPGARNAEQVRTNAAAAALPPLSADDLAAVRSVYDELLRPSVHGRW